MVSEKVPWFAISKGASWEQGLCGDRSHTADGAAVRIDVLGRGGTNSTAEKVPTHGAVRERDSSSEGQHM